MNSEPVTVDLNTLKPGATGRERELAALTDSLIASGSFYLGGTGLDERRISDAVRLQEKLFALDEAEKARFICPQSTGRRGYIPFATESAGEGQAPDPKEIWHISSELQRARADAAETNLWPAIDGFEDTFTELNRELDRIAIATVHAAGEGLGIKTHAADLVEGHNSVIRLLSYRPESGEDLLAGGHRDVNLITIHLHHSEPGYESRFDDKWSPGGPKPGLPLVCAGEMFAYLSKGRVRSPEHRVRNVLRSGARRQFLGYFVNPRPGALLLAEGEAPLCSTKWLHQRSTEIRLNSYFSKYRS